MAFVVGPITAGIVIKRSGARRAYQLSAAVAAVQLLLMASQVSPRHCHDLFPSPTRLLKLAPCLAVTLPHSVPDPYSALLTHSLAASLAT